jgi:hypothetical protein
MGLEKIVNDFDLFGIETHPIPPNPHGLRAKRTSPNMEGTLEIPRWPDLRCRVYGSGRIACSEESTMILIRFRKLRTVICRFRVEDVHN